MFVFAVFDAGPLQYHVVTMALGQCLTAFFAVWTVHHDCAHATFPARTLRHSLKVFFTYSMFYHVEHPVPDRTDLPLVDSGAPP